MTQRRGTEDLIQRRIVSGLAKIQINGAAKLVMMVHLHMIVAWRHVVVTLMHQFQCLHLYQHRLYQSQHPLTTVMIQRRGTEDLIQRKVVNGLAKIQINGAAKLVMMVHLHMKVAWRHAVVTLINR